jgi:hypothetical protein
MASPTICPNEWWFHVAARLSAFSGVSLSTRTSGLRSLRLTSAAQAELNRLLLKMLGLPET